MTVGPTSRDGGDPSDRRRGSTDGPYSLEAMMETGRSTLTDSTGSYHIADFAHDPAQEASRLNAQVDLFLPQELALYEKLGLRDGIAFLDCGCGPGYLIEQIHNRHPGIHCTGVDLSAYLLEMARSSFEAKGMGSCRVERQSVTSLSFPDNSFDFVVSRLVLEHLPAPMEAIREALRVLRPGGTAVFVDNDFDFHELTWPCCPALAEMYDAYRRARREDGGNPCIGRELPALMRSAGFGTAQLDMLVAHSELIGDAAFIRAEGAGIPSQLVKRGYLSEATLDRITMEWAGMLATPNHTICRVVFAASGRKSEASARITESADARVSSRSAPVQRQELATRDDALRLLVAFVVTETGITSEEADPQKSFLDHGVDSMAAVAMVTQMKKTYGASVSIAHVLSDRPIATIADELWLAVRGEPPADAAKGREPGATAQTQGSL